MLNKKIVFTLFIAAFFSGSLLAQKSRPRPPAKKTPTVKQLKQAPAAEKKATVGLSVERYALDIEINQDGTSAATSEVLQKFNSQIAVGAFGKYEQVFNGNLEKVEVLEAYILKANSTKVPVPASGISIRPTPQAEAAPSFSSLRMVEINFAGINVGDSIFYKLRTENFKPQFAGHFDEMEIFSAFFDWKLIEINVSAPPDFPVYAQAIDLTGGRIADADNRARWQWRRENFAAMEIEMSVYDYISDSPRIAVTSFKDFDELGAAYWKEASQKAVVTPEVQKLADEITKGIIEPQQQAYAVYEWANKNIRYLSIVLDRGGWIPNSTMQILTNGYGDCKDYTTILHALLKAKNIESHPVLIRSDLTDWFPDVASASFFNHAILYIPSLDVFADATAPNTRLGLIPQSIVGKKAFLGGAKTGVIQTPAGVPEDNQIISEIELNFTPGGALKAVSKNTYQGRSEMVFRPLFSDSTLQKNSEVFVSAMLGYYGIAGTGKILKIGNPFKLGEPFVINMEVLIEDYTTFTPKGRLRMPLAVNLMDMLSLQKFVLEDTRKTNLLLGATRLAERYVINLPADVKFGELPSNLNFTNELGSFRNEFEIEGNKLTVVRELTIKKDVVKARDYQKARDLINKVSDAFNTEIAYQANPNLLRQKARQVRVKPPAKIKSFEQVIADQIGALDEKPLTPRQTAQMEAKLTADPQNIATRRRLLRHYSNYDTKQTKQTAAARLKHRLWFVQNQPESEDDDSYLFFDKPEDELSDEYKTLKNEWMKQIAAKPDSEQIRLNAYEFARDVEPVYAEKLLLEGRKSDAENYRYAALLTALYYSQSESENPEDFEEKLVRAFETGENALSLLKKERSQERDDERRKLLPKIADAAFRLGKLDRAKTLATDFILDFGGDANNAAFDETVHKGNILLGRIALRENDLAKAKEYLLIAIRAPLRKEKNWLMTIDTKLARELFEKGEKEAVSEYLKLCESLWHLKNYPNLYEDEMKALKLWQEQIKQGATPSFDFEKM